MRRQWMKNGIQERWSGVKYRATGDGEDLNLVSWMEIKKALALTDVGMSCERPKCLKKNF